MPNCQIAAGVVDETEVDKGLIDDEAPRRAVFPVASGVICEGPLLIRFSNTDDTGRHETCVSPTCDRLRGSCRNLPSSPQTNSFGAESAGAFLLSECRATDNLRTSRPSAPAAWGSFRSHSELVFNGSNKETHQIDRRKTRARDPSPHAFAAGFRRSFHSN